MVLPAARTRDEAHLYLDLHPCDRCLSVSTTWDSTLTSVDGIPARRYAGVCDDCGTGREYLFALPEHAAGTRPGTVHFGGSQPSELLDPGEWLLVADLTAEAAAAATDPAEAAESTGIALAAMVEILKFVPAGADAVPADLFRTERGRTVYRQEPGRFRRRRLEIVRDAYRDALDRIGPR
ncbi:hypothetical protein AB0M79_01355 [Polymorphospora sp. NPDC051019]|uniref:hypothetical protein n=1 Tax=Polymorphospora sp. NPDC051019 TaxID=3155725 RepID=UPI003439722B